MGFILGFMANETFFDRRNDSRFTDHQKSPIIITEGDTLSNIRTDNCCRKMPNGPPPSLFKKEKF